MSTKITAAQRDEFEGLMSEAAGKQKSLLADMGIDPERFGRVMMNALARYPELAACTKRSIGLAVYRSCETGLMPDGRNSVIVPLKRRGVLTAEFWPMVYGLTTLARNNLPGVVFNTDCVFEGDEWIDERGSAPRMMHIPDPDADRNMENLVCAYATAHMPGNEICESEVIYRAELDKFKRPNAGPWASYPLEMCKIRPFKRLLKRMPLTPKASAMIGNYLDDTDGAAEDEFEGVTIDDETTAEVTEEKPKPARQRKSKAAPEPEPEELPPPAEVPPPAEEAVVVSADDDDEAVF